MTRRPRTKSGQSDVYLECTFVGSYARMAAIDARTGTEVVVFGPAKQPRSDLERLAINKLRCKLKAVAPKPAPKPAGRFA